MQMAPGERSVDKSVAKALTLLELLCDSDTPLGITAIATATSLGKSNVHRLLQTLIELGYAQKTDSLYAPTMRTWELGSKVVARLSVRDIARPAMDELASSTNEAVHLSMRDKFEVVYIDKIESKDIVRAYTQLGGRAPLHCTATGKAMLAFLPRTEMAQCMAQAMSFNSNTITSEHRFEIEAAQIRTNLYALNLGEWRADIVGIAVPIADHSGLVVAALGLSAPATRVTPADFESLAPRLVTYARDVSLALGCSAEQWAQLHEQVGP